MRIKPTLSVAVAVKSGLLRLRFGVETDDFGEGDFCSAELEVSASDSSSEALDDSLAELEDDSRSLRALLRFLGVSMLFKPRAHRRRGYLISGSQVGSTRR